VRIVREVSGVVPTGRRWGDDYTFRAGETLWIHPGWARDLEREGFARRLPDEDAHVRFVRRIRQWFSKGV
jgi:hypothetical protein